MFYELQLLINNTSCTTSKSKYVRVKGKSFCNNIPVIYLKNARIVANTIYINISVFEATF